MTKAGSHAVSAHEPGSPAPRDVDISGAEIPLGSFLKWAQVVASGGEAKQLIQQGRVAVNGASETRRHHALFPGDVVDIVGGGRLRVRGGGSAH